MEEFFAIDIGGTAIKYGIVNEIGEIKYFNSKETDSKRGKDSILEKVIEIIEELKNINNDVKKVGISSAGLVDSKKGEIIYAGYTIPGYTGTKLKEFVEANTDLKAEVENDVNCALLGEKWIGAGKHIENFVMITVGTGIGGAICLNNNLYTGTSFGAGEVGYMKVRGEDFQKVSSTSALIDSVYNKTKIEGLNGEKVFDLEDNNKEIKMIIENFFEVLAEGINNIVTVLNPEKIIIGGGISANPKFKEYLNSAFSKYIDDIRIKKEIIEIAKLGNKAGVVGAVYNIFN